MRPLYLRLSLIVASAGVGLALFAVALVPAAVGLARAGSADEASIDLGPLDQRSYVYAADGTVLATLKAEIDRQPIPLHRIPDVMVDAVLSVEDAEFYIHDGVNLRATLRALVRNVDQGQAVQGGSTITQQVVKAELVGDADTLERKAREAVLARRLEQQMTKDQILERYLNTVYFGNGAYGVQAAAETYFGIDAGDLDDARSAFLAGMIGSPSAFDPIRHPEASADRRSIALQRMVATGHMTPERAQVIRATPLPTKINRVQARPDSYFVEKVKQELLRDRRLGDRYEEREQALFRGGLRIYTTLDPKAQALAEESRNDVLAELAPEGASVGTVPITPVSGRKPDRYATAAVVSVEPGTGAIRAMVGGPRFDDDQFNITTDGAGRSGGSTFKIFVLMALLENGYVPSDSVNGTGPCLFQGIPGLDPDPWTLENFDGSVGSVGTITEQTLRSSNCAYVRLGQIVGIDEVIEQAHELGITTPLKEVASLPLGTEIVRPVDMAGAMAAIASDGLHATPYYVDRVEDHDGKLLFSHRPAVRRAASPQSARLATQILEANVRGGTGTRARIPGQHAAGKTGTGSEFSDAWFVGATPYLATAVWLGSPDDNSRVVLGGRGITGGGYPAEIWGRYMRAWHEGKPERAWKAPGSTRGGRYLQLPPSIDPGASTTTSSTLFDPFDLFPDVSFTIPEEFRDRFPGRTLPTAPPPSTPTTRPTPTTRGPNWPFDGDPPGYR